LQCYFSRAIEFSPIELRNTRYKNIRLFLGKRKKYFNIFIFEVKEGKKWQQVSKLVIRFFLQMIAKKLFAILFACSGSSEK